VIYFRRSNKALVLQALTLYRMALPQQGANEKFLNKKKEE